MATRVVANTTATNARVAAAIAPAKFEAALWSDTRSGREPTGAATTESSQMVRLAAPIAAATNMAGMNHKDTRTRWRKSTSHSGSGRTGSALIGLKSLKRRPAQRTALKIAGLP